MDLPWQYAPNAKKKSPETSIQYPCLKKKVIEINDSLFPQT